MNVQDARRELDNITREHGEQAATGYLVTVWNSCKVEDALDSDVANWADSQLESRKGWDMDRGGFLFME